MRSAGLATAKIHRGIGRDLISCVSITRTLMVSCRVAVASARRIRTGLTDQSVSQRESDQSLDVHASSAPETLCLHSLVWEKFKRMWRPHYSSSACDLDEYRRSSCSVASRVFTHGHGMCRAGVRRRSKARSSLSSFCRIGF